MKLLSTIIILAVTVLGLQAQYVNVADKPMSSGIHLGFTIEHNGLDQKTVDKEWTKYTKEYKAKTKRNRKTKEYESTGASIGGLGSSVNMYSVTNEIGDMVRQTVWVAPNNVFIAEGEQDKIDAVTLELENFIVQMKRLRVQQLLDGEEGLLKSLQKELDGEFKTEEKAIKAIDNYKQKIQVEEANIVTAKANQEKKSIEIEAQLEVIKQVKERLNKVSLEND